VINEVPAVARPETFEVFVYIHSHLGVVSTLIAEIQLAHNETPIRVDGGPDNWFTFKASP